MKTRLLATSMCVAALVFTLGSMVSADLLFSVKSSDLGADGSAITSWDGLNLIAGTPAVATVDGVKWENNTANSGFVFGGEVTSAIPVSGMTIVTAVRANVTAAAGTGDWNPISIVNLMYNRLALGATNDGSLWVNVNGNGEKWSRIAKNYGNGITENFCLANDTPTVLSLVVGTDGAFNLWANGTKVMSVGAITGGFTSLDPSWNATWADGHYLTLGRNKPDGWTAFNGKIGDTYVYTSAFSDTDRIALEGQVASAMGIGAPVPEPASILAMLSGLVGMAGIAIRRKS